MEKKVILLTGASSGIGLSAAIQLMNKGFRVYAASRRGSENRTSDNGGEIISTMMDVNREEDIKKVLDEILAQNGHLDAVISNAGNGIAGSIEDTSIEEAKYQFETNFFGAVRVVQACLPFFR